MTTTSEYRITGMTCSHCVASVREEVEEVGGVTATEVDLAAGRLTVIGDGFSDESIRDAVQDAGYEVAL